MSYESDVPFIYCLILKATQSSISQEKKQRFKKAKKINKQIILCSKDAFSSCDPSGLSCDPTIQHIRPTVWGKTALGCRVTVVLDADTQVHTHPDTEYIRNTSSVCHRNTGIITE